MQKDYDLFYETPGTVNEKNCPICGALCHVKRNVITASGYVAAMAHAVSPYDVFTCPNAETPWHDKAVRLVQEMEETPSKRLADLMRLDLEDLLKENLES
ncbi:MAG TPA: hypothetical protein PKW33_18555 [Anaerolineaceae bacterium]|nr:hypothetical protein [Anaerolineaceae bacterium]HPN53604.1 hypothetical protein [Anaerolineaceae bacterium]